VFRWISYNSNYQNYMLSFCKHAMAGGESSQLAINSV